MRGFWLKPKARKRQADGHVSNDHFFWSWSVTNVVRRSVRVSLWKDVFGTRQMGSRDPDIGRETFRKRVS